MRIRVERLERERFEPFDFSEAADCAADLRDARVEIDTLQAAVRDLRKELDWSRVLLHEGSVKYDNGTFFKASKTARKLLARTDKLLPEDE